MTLDWWTLALQILNFLVLMWLLQRFLYRPARRVIEERRTRAQAALAEARKLQEKATAKEAELEEKARALEAERRKLREELRKELEAERTRLLDTAREEARAIRDRARAALEEERRRTLEELRGELAGLAAGLARRILEELRGPLLDELFFTRLERHLAALPEEERRELLGDAGAQGAELRLVTANALPERRRRDWRNRLERIFGTGLTLHFAEDPALLAGVELDLPYTELRFTLAAQLARARQEMATADVETGA